MVSGRGPKSAEIMFVGEAPGEDEVAQNAPFVGKAGKFLTNYLLPGVGLKPEDVYMQNSVRCFPGRDKKGKIRNPSAENIRKCRHHLVDEVQRVRPKVIVAMGNAALHGCLELARWRDDEKKKDTQVTGITRWRGKRVWHPEFNCWVVFTYHPSFLMRLYRFQKFEYNQTIDDLEFAVQSVDDHVSVKPLKGILLLSNPELAYEYFKRVLYGKRHTDVAVDTETTTVDYREIQKVGKKALLGVSMSVDEPVDVGRYKATAVYVPRNVLFDGSVVALFQSILIDRKKENCGTTLRLTNVCCGRLALRSVGLRITTTSAP